MSIRWYLRSRGRSPLAPRDDAFVFFLDQTTSSVGRSRESHLCLNHPSVSRRHAELTLTRTQLVIRDLGSSNGTFVDGRLVATSMLRVGQEVRFGEMALVVGCEEQEEDDKTTRRNTLRKGVATASHEAHNNGATTQIMSPAASLMDRAKTLTEAQSRVFHWLVRGLSEKEIASQLKLSPRTVHNHIQAIYEHLGVHSRSHLMAQFLESQHEHSNSE